ncbi:MAG: CRISPR-associated protein Cas5 [candidate division Zixibacteria bacterium]|nr:CRISPR-associated protein Cas5 [candidate division Zixibacteria bacterium]
MKSYEVQMEIAGPAAMWTRPDTGAAQISYPAPTFSAAKGMFEAIAKLDSATIRPKKVEICKPLQYSKYTTNYGGPLRKRNQITLGSSYQLPAIILIDVCYRLYGVVEEVRTNTRPTNHLHALQDMFNRRLLKGQSYSTPCLGWNEFTPSYVGSFRQVDSEGNKIEVQISMNEIIPSMLHEVFDSLSHGAVAPRFRQNVMITNGVLSYEESEIEVTHAQ